jgi:hypothetical protein
MDTRNRLLTDLHAKAERHSALLQSLKDEATKYKLKQKEVVEINLILN